MNLETRTRGGRVYVTIDGRSVAIMERSPFTGEYCYGLQIGDPARLHFRPAFTPTSRRTIAAAAKVVANALKESN